MAMNIVNNENLLSGTGSFSFKDETRASKRPLEIIDPMTLDRTIEPLNMTLDEEMSQRLGMHTV